MILCKRNRNKFPQNGENGINTPIKRRKSEGKRRKKGRDRFSKVRKECNRKLLSELPMASSQSFQTRRNSRQKAVKEARCQEGASSRTRRAGRTCGLLSQGDCSKREEESMPKAANCLYNVLK